MASVYDKPVREEAYDRTVRYVERPHIQEPVIERPYVVESPVVERPYVVETVVDQRRAPQYDSSYVAEGRPYYSEIAAPPQAGYTTVYEHEHEERKQAGW